ncbi:MAG: hypothetical protein CVU30_06360 [Betaproteobacteria bacterium HGW-Betaproteobacteria-3]|nr:MAG: hypothetical protein CVU30_06360 [Betaproteobacteria bacterium HGW-Betaproteobacteria-3]
MATPNYGYEKRQKELAKRKKKEEKLKAKAERKQGAPEDGTSPPDADAEDGAAGTTPPDTPAQP